jgi:hypothetical protein
METAVRGIERVRDWLDDRGRLAWIAVTVIGFVLFWPVGLALLIYMIWSKRMGCNWGRHRHFEGRHGKAGFGRGTERTGNTAFDTYREDTLRRLEEERDAFLGFLDQLRAAKDKAEFDQFMSSRQAPQAG